MKNEILSEPEITLPEKETFSSLEGIFHDKIEHTDKEIKAARLSKRGLS